MSETSDRTPTRVVTFGEMLLRLSPPSFERLFQSPQFQWYFGGSEANVAASLAQFGVESEYVTCLPDNPVGDAALAALSAAGIVTRHVVRSGSRLGIYFVELGADIRQMRIVYDRAGSAFSEMQPHVIPWSTVLRATDRLHISGITPALSSHSVECAAEAVAAARAAGIPISMDLNFRPAMWGTRDPRPIIRPLAESCDILVGNLPAVRAMLGIGSAADDTTSAHVAERTVRTIREQVGCAVVALTRRDVVSASEHRWSATLYDGISDRIYNSRTYHVRVIDRVGGGDAFAAGLIHALLGGQPAAHALDFATAASALKLTIPGDFNRVSIQEVNSLLASRTED